MDLTSPAILIMLGFPLFAMAGMLMMSRVERSLTVTGRAARTIAEAGPPLALAAGITPGGGDGPNSGLHGGLNEGFDGRSSDGGSVAAAAAGLLDAKPAGEPGLADELGERRRGRANTQLGVDATKQEIRPEQGGETRDVDRPKFGHIHRHHSAAPAQQLADLLAET